MPLSRRTLLTLSGSALLLGGLAAKLTPSSAEGTRLTPPPAVNEAAPTAATEVAVFAGGCFWGVQGVFQHVEGVSNAVSGYAGGDKASADYETVSSGRTGHAESVKITFDPHRISYGQLLQIFFSVAHDPTELNRQGPDTGTQYRSAIFPLSSEQERVAKAYIAQLGQAHVFDAAIVTTLEPGRSFFPAEGYHQDYLTRNPHSPYIMMYDLPKIAALKALMPAMYRPNPILVATAGVT